MARNPFGHIDLRVRDIDEAAQFFDGWLPSLGFSERYDGDEWIVFATAGELPSAAYFAITETREHATNANRIAFWVESRDDVERIARLVAQAGGTELSGPKEMPYGPDYFAVYFADPSGNRFEVYHRTD
jgi:catechol 2,3-dioxygenase-like lactoylglutathione lyase family enzyme